MSGSVCQYCQGKGCHLCGGTSVKRDLSSLLPKDLPAVCYRCKLLIVCLGESRKKCVEVNSD